MAVIIAKESPVGPDLTLLFTRHTADMHADTPPESIHMMDASELAIPAVQFFVDFRKQGLRKPPSTAELINWLQILVNAGASPAKPRHTVSCRMLCVKLAPSEVSAVHPSTTTRMVRRPSRSANQPNSGAPMMAPT